MVQFISTLVMYIAIITKSIMSTTSLERFRVGNRVDPVVIGKNVPRLVCHIYDGSENNIELPEPPAKPVLQKKVSLQELKDTLKQERNLTIPVPMTGATLTLSKKDIITTASLSAQLLVMILTLSMTVKAVKISGRRVIFDEWFSSWMCFLFAHTMTTLVDPLVCVICSSEYRNALHDLFSRAIRG